MGESKITEKYFAKDVIYDEAGYRKQHIPKGAEVKYLEEYTNFYGRYVKIVYGEGIYYTKPEHLVKKVIRSTALLKAVPGASAHHARYGALVMMAELVVKQEGLEFWCVKDKKGELHVVDIKDCTDIRTIDRIEEKEVTYYG